MGGILKFLGVAALAAADLFLAIPAGVAADYDFVELFLAMFVGGLAGGVLTTFLGDSAQRWWRAHKKVRSRPKPRGWIDRAAEKWGAPGLGLLSPGLVGTPAGAMIGVGLGLDRRAMLVWLTIGVALWSAALAGLTAAGVNAAS